VFFAPVFSAATAFATFLLASELKDTSAGLFAAIFVGVAPGYISRSVAGSYDNEGIAIFLLIITFYFWIKASKTGSAFYGAVTALWYFYMVSAWGGYVFIINLIPLHVLALMLMGRYTHKHYVSYSTFYVLGTLYSMQIPFVGFQPTFTSEHMGALGVFGLCQIVSFVLWLKAILPARQFKSVFMGLMSVAVAVVAALAYVGYRKGYVAPWAGRFYSLWDTGYAKVHIPIIASVSEHQPTAWPSFIFDLQLLILLFPAGVYFSFQQLKDEHVFLVIYSVFAAYFSGVMVRLMLTLTPIVSIASGIAASTLVDTFVKKAPKEDPTERKPRRILGIPLDVRFSVLGLFVYLLSVFMYHSTWVTSNAYSSPSIVMSTWTHDGHQYIIDDFREAYNWLNMNTKQDAKILSWWDYGYQLAGMADRVTLVDNNTWNNTHIATVGLVLASPEPEAYEIMQKLHVDYVLVIFGGIIGYSGDDINKFLWMIRIAEGVYPDKVKESNFFARDGQYRVDDSASQTMRESVLYKTSYYRFNEVHGGMGQDRVRGSSIQTAPISLTTLEEAYTTENWIVRIYKVKERDNLSRSLQNAAQFAAGKRKKRKIMKV
jgi:dolichyl-diphosphooligosaccharide--protein glycosyltransferase